MDRKNTAPVSGERFPRFFFALIVIALVVGLIWYFAGLVVYLIIGVVLAYLLKPIVDRFQGIGLARVPSILVTFVLVGGIIGLLVIYLLPFVTTQIVELSNQITYRKAAQITAVEPGSAAERGGLLPNEFVVSIDSSEWNGYSQMESIVRSKSPGDSILVVSESEEGVSRSMWLKIRRQDRRRVETNINEALGVSEERRLELLGLTVREVVLSDVATFLETKLQKIIPMEHGAIINGVSSAFEELFRGERITETVGSVVDLFTNLFYGLIVIPLTTFFFLKDGGDIRRRILGLVPNRYFEISLAIVEKVETNIGRYLRALMLQCLTITSVAALLLHLAGLHYWLAVGIFTGLAVLIPYIGPLMSYIAGILVGVAQAGDASLLAGILLALVVTHLVDNMVVQPLIFSRAAKAHPLVILFAVLIGAQVAGIIGMLVAIPLTASIRVTVEQISWSWRNYRILRTPQ